MSFIEVRQVNVGVRGDADVPKHCVTISIVKPTRCTIFRVYWISLYMFRTVFSSIIRSSRLYIQLQVYVIQVSWLLASGHEMWVPSRCPLASSQQNLFDIYLMLYVQSWTPDDGRKDRPKYVEWYSINSKIVHFVGFTIEIYHDTRSHERQNCVTIQKAVGSIPDRVSENLHWHNPPGRTVALGWTNPLTEMSARDISWGGKGGRSVRLSILTLYVSRHSDSLWKHAVT